MQLKTDENGYAIVQDGKPIYVHDDGQEIAFDAQATMAKISQLNSEAKNHREEKQKAQSLLKSFDGLDADEARRALELVKNLDDKRLIDAGEVEKVKAEARKALDEQLAQKDAQIKKINDDYRSAVIGGEFARSGFIKDKTLLPPDIAQNACLSYPPHPRSHGRPNPLMRKHTQAKARGQTQCHRCLPQEVHNGV